MGPKFANVVVGGKPRLQCQACGAFVKTNEMKQHECDETAVEAKKGFDTIYQPEEETSAPETTTPEATEPEADHAAPDPDLQV